MWALALPTAILIASPAFAMTEAELLGQLQSRFAGDRSGACVMAAVIEATGGVGPDGADGTAGVARAKTCATPRADGGPGLDAAFEIGSISKTMVALLVAQLIEQGRWSLDDPIARHLPEGTQLPSVGGRDMTVRDLVTHRSGLPGLPPGYRPTDPANFYGSLTEAQLLQALGRTTLRAPGQYLYSNFGMMVVSLAVSRALRVEAADDLDSVLRQQVFGPLGMRHAHIARPPPGVLLATGHLPGGATTPAWTITPNLGGVGMVRATLDDMQRYAQLAAGIGASPLAAAMRRSQQPLAAGSAMNWSVIERGGKTYLFHGGATGGFSSAIAVHPASRRAAVVLADTSLVNLTGLHALALRLIGADMPIERPRLAVPMSAHMLRAAPGEYELGALTVTVVDREGRLFAKPSGQGELELLLDNHGDLYPTRLDALLRPVIEADRVVRFTWLQGGGALEGVRSGISVPLTASNPAWKPWAGEYRLAPTFTLKVFERDGKLMLQGSGQPAIEATVTGDNRIEVARLGVVVDFIRAGDAPARAAVLRQNGQVTEGDRVDQPR